MTIARILRGALLNPTPDGGAEFFADGALFDQIYKPA